MPCCCYAASCNTSLQCSTHTCSANKLCAKSAPPTHIYTHCGPLRPTGNASDPGLMVLSLQRIFAAAASSVCAGEEVEVCCSYIEVYNEVSAAGGRRAEGLLQTSGAQPGTACCRTLLSPLPPAADDAAPSGQTLLST
jgi:hypothetical protein